MSEQQNAENRRVSGWCRQNRHDACIGTALTESGSVKCWCACHTPTSGASLIATERQRQIKVEGYSRVHDFGHGSYSLWRAARCYEVPYHLGGVPDLWPWVSEAWKPRDIVSNLIRAGALYQAALDVAPPLGQDAPMAREGYERCRRSLDEILGYRRGERA